VIVLPVMERELRAEARHAVSYWLRTLGALVLLVVMAVMLIGAQDNAPELGAKLFGNLNTALFVTIWLLVPLLTADCLSRERREGTLGILFLTPLTARAIIIGKGLIHSLRALTMVLAALPILAIPFLLGGVTWREGLMVLLLDLNSVGLALAAGLVASAYCRQWNRALLLAEVLASMFLCGFAILFSLLFAVQVAIPYMPGFALREVGLEQIIFGGAVLCTDVAGMWSEGIKFLPVVATRAWLGVVGEMFMLAMLFLGLAVLWVASRVERSRQEKPATLRQLRRNQFLFAPRFWKSLFRSKMRRTLERNPIGWLQQYSTAARMTQWGWCLFTVIAESVLVAGVSWYDLEWPQYFLLLLLALSLAASAAGSFRRERETGALELILVTPLSLPQIILGRLRGLWRQFLPALGMLLCVLAFLNQTGLQDQWYWRWESHASRGAGVAVLIACTFLTLPVVGLYFSLAKKSFLAAWLTTIAVGLAVPVVVTYIGVLLMIDASTRAVPVGFQIFGLSFLTVAVMTGALQTVFASLFTFFMFRNLRYRKFALAS